MSASTSSLYSHITFSVWRRETVQPPLEYLQGNITVEATWGCEGYWLSSQGAGCVFRYRGYVKYRKACSVHLLHGEVPDIAAQLTAAGRAAGELGPAVGADQVAGVTLGAGVGALGHWGPPLPGGSAAARSRNRRGTRRGRRGRCRG